MAAIVELNSKNGDEPCLNSLQRISRCNMYTNWNLVLSFCWQLNAI